MKIVIIDYGSGNLKSVENAFIETINNNDLNFSVEVSNQLYSIKEADYIVLPGVGAYPDCKNGLIKIEGLIEVLIDQVIKKSRPFLGICVGMQLYKKEHPILKQISSTEQFYFVHSYYLNTLKKDQILADTNYNQKIPAIVGKENFIGVQFHPEKSSKAGQKIIGNWLKWKP